MASVKFDGTQILNSTYTPRFVKHESAPDRTLSTVDLQREDGSVIVSTRYGMKSIVLSGILVGTTQADLEDKIDAFKELFSREQKRLEVSWSTTVRYYTATCARHQFDRDYFHLLYVPWTAEFTVPEGLGYGDHTQLVLGPFTTTTPYVGSFTLLGSKAPKPLLTITPGATWDTSRGVQFKNLDTGEKIIMTVPGYWEVTKSLYLDCNQKTVNSTVTGSYLPVLFYGVFPTFRVGVNNFEIRVGDLTVTEVPGPASLSNNAFALDSSTKKIAQSFIVPYKDTTFNSIALVIDKQGTPLDFNVLVSQDDGTGKPSFTSITAATYYGANITGAPAFYTVSMGSNYTLLANTRYWIVAQAAGGDLSGSNYFRLWFLPSAYRNGFAATSTDIGTTWTVYDGVRNAQDYDLMFRVNVGGRGAATTVYLTVDYDKTYL